MRKRNIHIQVWLDRKEAEALDNMSKLGAVLLQCYCKFIFFLLSALGSIISSILCLTKQMSESDIDIYL